MKLLRNMEKTTRRQAILQHTVEGLSVIVISYYLSGLGSYVFKAMETLGWIENHDLFSGLFVPISMGIAFGLLLVGRQLIYKRRFDDSVSDPAPSDPSQN